VDNIWRDGNQMDKCTILISHKHMRCEVLWYNKKPLREANWIQFTMKMNANFCKPCAIDMETNERQLK
jgi:hypothetical protein